MVDISGMVAQRQSRIVGASLDNHLRTSSHISKRTANRAVQVAEKRLGPGGIFGVLRYDSPKERDPRWDMFVRNLRCDTINTGNGIYVPELDVLAIHGQEVTTLEGCDVLAIGHSPEQTIKHGEPLMKTALEIREYGAIGIIAAPYHVKGAGKLFEKRPELIRNFHGVQVFSGEAEWSVFGSYPHANTRAEDLYKRLRDQNIGLFRFVGDDGHSIQELGRTYAKINMPSDYMQFENNPQSLVNALLEGYKHASLTEEFHTAPAKLGAVWHAIGLATLKCASKLGLNPNTQTAPFLERLGIHV